MAQAAPTAPNVGTGSVVSAPPERPAPASRPPSWPGGEGESSPWIPPEQRTPQPQPETPAAGKLKPCQGTKIIARVGSVAVLDSEVNGAVNELIERNKDRIPPDQLEAQRNLLIKQRLKSLIEAKLIYQDAKRTIPAEGWVHIQEQLEKEFEDKQLERMTKSAGVKTPQELDQKLRALGTSLEQEKRSFCERLLAQQWQYQQIKRTEEITCDRTIEYYHKHLKDFTKPARVKWEELMVSFSKHAGKEAARNALALMGNQVLAGTPLSEVAKRGSDGPTASEGGNRRWTTQGSLVCEELDRALFSVPIGQLSPIIESPNGYHIVRVTEREQESVTPFLEAQVEIREIIVREQTDKQLREYMAQLEARTPVWTIFDEADGRQLISSRPEELR